MNYGEIKTALRSLINRKDITNDLADQFVSMAQTRLETKVRPSFLQRLTDFTIPAVDNGSFTLPTDYLELVSFYTDTGGEIERVGPKRFLSLDSGTGLPTGYFQNGSTFKVRPIPEETETLWIHYYGQEDVLSAESDINNWSAKFPFALIYGAAVFAAHYFEDERLSQFSEQYAIFLSEIEDHIWREDYSGPARIEPAYSLNDGVDY